LRVAQNLLRTIGSVTRHDIPKEEALAVAEISNSGDATWA
jgi:hypothetical protein